MTNGRLMGTKGQSGQAFILVLIALALGSMIVTPTLNYVVTGLTDVRIAEEHLLEQYTADAGVEFAMWQLKYDIDGMASGLNPENPSSNTTVSVNGVEIPIQTSITQSSVGEDWPLPIPASVQGVHLDAALVIEPPYFSPDEETAYFKHRVYMYNSGSSAVHLKAVFQQLDPQFAYLEGSYTGPEADLTMDYIGDQWELYFDFASPLPGLSENEATFISFTVTADGDISDNYSSNGWVEYAAFEGEEGALFEGEYTLTTIGHYYDITVTSGSYTILANVGVTEEGEVILRSYQFQ